MTRRLLETLIDKHCLSQFTWTGKTGTKDVKKDAFKKLVYIPRLVIDAIKKVDSSYDFKFFQSDMTKHVIKYAFRIVVDV